jgi:hypothetical protein
MERSTDSCNGAQKAPSTAASVGFVSSRLTVHIAPQIGSKFPAAQLVAGTVPDLDINPDAALSRAGFLTMKRQGADWRSWKLRWCVLDGEQLSWSKTPKIGKDTIKSIGSISLKGAKIHAGQAQTAAHRFFRVRQASGEETFFAGESRKDTVEWVHLLQHVAGHVALTAPVSDIDVVSDSMDPASASGSAATTQRLVKLARGISKAGYVHFRRDKKSW